jgi:FkbM family methyltransferase
MKKVIERILSLAGIALTSSQNLADLRTSQEEFFDFKSIVFESKAKNNFSVEGVGRAVGEIRRSTAQLHQDLITLLLLDFKNDGYFVEFGATNGIKFSNSMLLETSYGWHGILAEPGRKWQKELKKNRSAIIETRCVWKNTGEFLEFNETEVGELSTLEMFSSSDLHANSRKSGVRYEVETVSLEELLEVNQAPTHIDYLSIDTEGSEFHILKGFNFTKFTFSFISCEHNFTDSREQVRDLLESKGYVRILEEMSSFDDWFVSSSLAKTKGFI